MIKRTTYTTRLLLVLGILLISINSFSQAVKFDPYTSIYKKRSSVSKKHILYIGGGDYHDDLRKASILRKLLEIEHNYFVTYTEDYGVFVHSLSDYDLILINTKINNLTEPQYKALLSAVKKGMPVLGIHAASASFRNTSKAERSEFYKMIGAKFDHHPKMHEFTVHLEKNNSLLDVSYAGYDVFDELYYYANYEPENQVLLWSSHNKEKSPMAWVKTYGKGKVFYTALGHSPAVTSDKNFQKLILFATDYLLQEE
jgi:type 1 glutamine amidotransferase